ncbi:hypothetical protein [Shewanella algae]|uniref:hypothetical protein n=1 Tax=Shewanella algae TaxID=38313 RepID=UPI001AAE3982|nr:hypothetical protein [Shewanella algae]MBO2582806.1 hypothetical protein [Shewanella algae]
MVIVTQDLWNDFGWYVEIQVAEVLFTLYFSKYGPEEKWQFIIEPNIKFSLISRILGKKRPSFITELKKISLDVEDFFTAANNVSELKFTTTKKGADWVNSTGSFQW